MLLHPGPLALFFLVILLAQVAASALVGLWRSPGFWLLVGAMILVLLAGTPFVLIFGVGLMAVTSWCLRVQATARPTIFAAGGAIFAVGCLMPALTLPVSSPAFLLVVLGTGTLAGLAVFFNAPLRADAALPAALSALMSGGMLNSAFYILIHYVFITAARSQQGWWGGMLMVAGALSIGGGALKAALAIDLRDVLVWSSAAAAGLITMAVGVALQAEITDRVTLSGLALQAVLFGILAHGLLKPLLFIGMGEVSRAVGTTSLNWLGGLMRGMPRLGVLMLLGAAGMTMLPLGPAFTPLFLLIHALIGMVLQEGGLACFGGAILLAVSGLGMALLLLAATKFIGLGFLGRPRSLHAAAAEDTRSGPFAGMVLLGMLSAPLALVPGFVLLLCAPVVSILAPLAQTDKLTYAPLTLCLLAGLVLLMAGFVQTRWGVNSMRETSAWNGGLGRPPTWLPFGDPHTQSSGSGFVQPLSQAFEQMAPMAPTMRWLARTVRRFRPFAAHLVRQRRRLTSRFWLACLFGALLLALLAFSLTQKG